MLLLKTLFSGLLIRNGASAKDCRENVRLGEPGEFPIILLSSIQGSGNTWTRMLIESATGIFTGSKYNERKIYEENGFIGELEPIDAGTTIAAKNHGKSLLEESGAVILVMRNPYDAFKAEFNRKQTPRTKSARSHVGHADPAAFNSTEWIDSINHVAGRWRNFYVGYAETTAKLNIPIHLIYYENLKDNTIGEVKDLLQFYEDSIGFIPDHKDERIACLEQTAMETFKRKKTELNWEIYNTDQINKINQLIVEVRDAFQKVGLPKMPFYLKEAKETRHDVL